MKIVAEFDVDEDMLKQCVKEEGLDEMSIEDRIIREFDWLEKSGISLIAFKIKEKK